MSSIPRIYGSFAEFEREELRRRGFEGFLLRRIAGPECRRIVDLPERDLVSLDQVERHRLRLQRFDHLRRGKLDHGGDVLPARGRLGDDLDEQGAPKGACDIG